jgi:3-hydroxyisobutyrate dehydrogenase
MGMSMCGHLLNAGYPVTLYTRTKSKAQPLLDRGAAWADSPSAVCALSNTIITMVGFPVDVREVYFGPHGLIACAKPGSILIDMTSTEPSLSREIAGAASVRGLQALDAPVSGGDLGARKAVLSIMIGGEAVAVGIHTLLLALETLSQTRLAPQGSSR